MYKTLGTIQGLAKLGRVLSIVVLVFAIIGMIGCALGGVLLYALGDAVYSDAEMQEIMDEALAEEGMTAEELAIEQHSMVLLMIIAFLSCTVEVIISDRAAKYFKFEISEGTPFTFAGAKRLKNLGILAIVLPIVFGILSSAIEILYTIAYPEATISGITFSISIGSGVIMLIFALIFKHGAELVEAQKKAQSQKAELEKKIEKANERRGYYF